ncbi:MAG TPA: cellulase family glycosylhydrolase [Marmoricola sp.]
MGEPTRRRRLLAVATTLVSAAAVTLGLAPSSPATARPTGVAARPAKAKPAAVSTRGRWLVDRQGRTIYVHGLQIAHKTTPYHPPKKGVTAEDARIMKSLGINAVRLAWFWKGLEPRRGHFNMAYLHEIIRELRVLTKNGLWVLLEFHQDDYNEAVHGAGFPDWATFTDGAPNTPDTLPGGAYMSDPALEAAFRNLWNNTDGVQDAMAQAWRVVARAAKPAAHGRLLGYDMFNEPWPGITFPLCLPPLGCAGADHNKLQPLQDKLALAIRKEDRTTPVVYEPFLLADFGAKSHLRKPPAGVGPAVFSFHDYCMISGATKKADHDSQAFGYQLCPTFDKMVYTNGIKTADSMGAAVLQGEFGDTQDMVEVERIMQLADSHLTGWMEWGYKDWIDYPGGIGDGDLFDNANDRSTMRQKMANTLARPAPQLISGTPTSYSYDPTTGRMVLTWKPRKGVTAPTVLYVPVSRHYPHGYKVVVTHGRLLGKHVHPRRMRATHFKVRNTGGAVRLVLTRR